MVRNALTIDVEDYFQVSGFEQDINRDDWPAYEPRVERNTHRILQLLDDQQVHATFFVLGWVAERFPQLVRDIDDAGHEIGSHSYWHRLTYDLSPEEFRQDLARSRDVLEDLIGKPVQSFRAPSFSITNRSLWALDILAEEGFTVDSSIFPIHHDRYGIPDAPRQPHRRETAGQPLWEFPASAARFCGVNLPASGGGYFRLLPYSISSRILRQINAERPFVFYFHPWEVDPEQPRLKAGTRLNRFRHYVNLNTTEAKLIRLLTDFSFGRLDQSLAEYRKSSHRTPCDEPSNTHRTPCDEPAPK
ncbi:DUF3473 domain-containing protein [Pirellulales bacterium]|nr:DUF3473 domain-containing protein [Pirellulales bacterium]